MYLMQPYDDALQEILDHGVEKSNVRTGVKTLSIFGMCKRYPLHTPFFPIATRRKIWPMSVFSELLWYLEGSTSNDRLVELGCKFWTPWVDDDWTKQRNFEPDAFGPVYGFNLRHFGGNYNKGIHGTGYGFGGFDQLEYVMDRIKKDTSCRRIIWSLWNPKELDNMRLPPCHLLFQILIDDERRMTGIMYQRSCDFPVGVPANIQFYSAITCMLAQQTDCKPHEFVHMTADSHIYWDQIGAVEEYLKLPVIDSPKLEIKKAKDIFSYTPDDFVLTDFNCGPKLEIPVAV
jgi:thymidylate synthase